MQKLRNERPDGPRLWQSEPDDHGKCEESEASQRRSRCFLGRRVLSAPRPAPTHFLLPLALMLFDERDARAKDRGECQEKTAGGWP